MEEGEIYADEIGIHYAVRGEKRIGSCYGLVCELHGSALVPVGVEAGLTVDGLAVVGRPGEDAEAAFVEEEQAWRLAPALHLFNRVHLGMTPRLFLLDVRADDAPLLPDALHRANGHATALDEAPLPPRSVLCRLPALPSSAGERAALAALAVHGLRFSIDGFAFAGGSLKAAGLSPAVAELSGQRLAEMRRYPEAAALLAPLVASFKRQGMTVLARDLATADDLRMAVEAGVDCFSGPLLGPPMPAGSDMDFRPKPLAGLLPERGLHVVSVRP